MFKSAMLNKNVCKDSNDNDALKFVPPQNPAVKHCSRTQIFM